MSQRLKEIKEKHDLRMWLCPVRFGFVIVLMNGEGSPIVAVKGLTVKSARRKMDRLILDWDL